MATNREAEPGILGLGCMRLSTNEDRDRDRSIAVIHAALDAGVRLLDTADSYGWDESEAGHNERLIADALATWPGDRAPVQVVTKGGIVRPGGRWVPDGRAQHLEAACEASLLALRVDRLDLYLLHTPDPRRPFDTSVRALARLREAGLTRFVGLANVTVGHIRRALAITRVDAVEVPLNPFDDEYFRNGVAELCLAEGIRLIAHSPFGGPRRAGRVARDETLRRVAAAHGATPQELALAWLLDLDPSIVPVPGATRPETARSLGRAMGLTLGNEDRAALAERFPAAASLRSRTESPRRSASSDPRRSPAGPAEVDEIVLLMGIPAAGKSVAAARYLGNGYVRLNRDLSGGRLRDLIPELEATLRAGTRRVVMDNTYASRAERNRVVEVASRHGVPVRCVWLDTPLEEAQINAVLRMLSRDGSVLTPEEIRRRSRREPGVFDPRAQFRYRRSLEPPSLDEGFSAVERVPFERAWTGRGSTPGLIIEYDGVVRRSRAGSRPPTSPGDVVLVPGAKEALAHYHRRGSAVLGLAWHPEVEEGTGTRDAVERTMARTHELLGLELEWAFCPHRPGPPTCWCRKPLPGLVVPFLERHRLDPRRCVHVGPSSADRTLAGRLGMSYLPPEEFLAHAI